MSEFIRQARKNDQYDFIELSGKLSRFNRERHVNACKTDDFRKVSKAIRARAEKTFLQRSDDIIILMAEVEEKVCGYALARIIQVESWVDNGTERMGLFDELYID